MFSPEDLTSAPHPSQTDHQLVSGLASALWTPEEGALATEGFVCAATVCKV